MNEEEEKFIKYLAMDIKYVKEKISKLGKQKKKYMFSISS